MATWRRIVGCGMAVATGLVVARSAAAEPVVVVHVDNRTVVAAEGPSQRLLQDAQDVATAIYQAIGVRLVWSDDTAAPTSAMRLTVVLLSGGDERRVLADTGFHSKPGTFGVAPPHMHRVYVFWERINDFAGEGFTNKIILTSADALAWAKNRGLDASLGRVLAHELGHQLLPGCQHSKIGIMSAKVDLRSPTVPSFTAEQGESIRTLLTASMQAQASSASCSAN